MTRVPSISHAEWTVMKALWQKAPLSAAEVSEALASDTDWHPKTVRTLLGRLVDKQALSREKRGGVYRFTPRVAEEDCVREESASFLQQYFGGALQPMLAHFLEHEDLDGDDMAALRAMLDKKMAREDD